VGAHMIKLEVWLYGSLARYGGVLSRGSYAQLHLEVPEGMTVGELCTRLGMSAEERGITFINGWLTAMPGVPADLERELKDGDRIGLFPPESMWPFQYRFGAPIDSELRAALRRRPEGAVHHTWVSGSLPLESWCSLSYAGEVRRGCPPLAGGTAKPLGSAPRTRGACPLLRSLFSFLPASSRPCRAGSGREGAGARQNKTVSWRGFASPNLPSGRG